MIILRNKQFSSTTKEAKEELLKYIKGDKLVDFSKLSIDDAEEVKKMLISLDQCPYEFITERSKPYVPENVEGIFDKLGMEKTSKGIREMIYKSTNPEILKRVCKDDPFGISKGYDKDSKESYKLKLRDNARDKIKTFISHNTPLKQDGGDIESWYNKNVAEKDKNGKLRKIHIVDKDNNEAKPEYKYAAYVKNVIDSNKKPKSEGVYATKDAKKSLGTIAHEAGHEQDINNEITYFGTGVGGTTIGEELSASTRANKNMREMGKSKEEIRQGNKLTGIALSTYLPKILTSNMGNYLINQTHLEDKIKKN